MTYCIGPKKMLIDELFSLKYSQYMDRIDGLRTFVSVVEAGSFTAASDRLGISKKLASKYLGELEAQVGVRLLNRTTRSLSLTSAGRRFLPRAIGLIESYDDMLADLRETDRGLGGTLRVAAPVTFGELYLHEALSAFRDQHPDLVLDLRLNDRFVDLAAEGFDLAIRIGTLTDSALMARRLAETQLIVVGTPDYLEINGRPGHPKDLAQHCCIRDSNLRAGQSWPFETSGVMRRHAVTGGFLVNSASAVRLSVLRGDGLGLCPSFAVAQDIAAGRLEQVLLDFPSGTLGIHAVFNEARHLPARTRTALDFLATHFRTPPWQG